VKGCKTSSQLLNVLYGAVGGLRGALAKCEGESVTLYVRDNERSRFKSIGGFGVIDVPKSLACSRYVALFTKTPEDIVCPQFWELKWALGCPYSCSYCYLQGTLYGKKHFRMKNPSELKKELEKLFTWADKIGVTLLLNAGELSDSLAVPHATKELLEVLREVLQNHPHHRILMVTKAGLPQTHRFIKSAKGLEEFLIVSYSVNAHSVAKAFEIAPSPSERLKAAREVRESGFTVRLRLDPVIPVESWRTEYGKLIEEIFASYVEPERITIGTLRGLAKTLKYSKDKRWIVYLKSGEKTGWGLKLQPEIREENYIYIIEKLKEGGYKGSISLCKETRSMWQRLVSRNLLEDPGTPGVWEKVACNCKL